MVRPAATAHKSVNVKVEAPESNERADCAVPTIAKSRLQGPEHQGQRAQTRIPPPINTTTTAEKHYLMKFTERERGVKLELVENSASPEKESAQQLGMTDKEKLQKATKKIEELERKLKSSNKKNGLLHKTIQHMRYEEDTKQAQAHQLAWENQRIKTDLLNSRQEVDYLRDHMDTMINDRQLLSMMLAEANRRESEHRIAGKRKCQKIKERNVRLQNHSDTKDKTAIRYWQQRVEMEQKLADMTTNYKKVVAKNRTLTETNRALKENARQVAHLPNMLALDDPHATPNEKPRTPVTPDPTTPRSPSGTREPRTPEPATPYTAEPWSPCTPDGSPVRRLKRCSNEADGFGSSTKKPKKD